MQTIIQLDRTELQELIRTEVRTALIELPVIQPEPLPDHCGFAEVMQITGLRDSAIYKKTMDNSKDPIPHKKFGKRLIFSRRELEQWMESRTTRRTGLTSLVSKHLADVANSK